MLPLLWILLFRCLFCDWCIRPLFDLRALRIQTHRYTNSCFWKLYNMRKTRKKCIHLTRTERTDMYFVRFPAHGPFSHPVSLIYRNLIAPLTAARYAVSGPMRLELIIYLRRSLRAAWGQLKNAILVLYDAAVIADRRFPTRFLQRNSFVIYSIHSSFSDIFYASILNFNEINLLQLHRLLLLSNDSLFSNKMFSRLDLII